MYSVSQATAIINFTVTSEREQENDSIRLKDDNSPRHRSSITWSPKLQSFMLEGSAKYMQVV